MIGPGLASIVVNPFHGMRWLREPLGSNDRILEAPIFYKRDENGYRVVARPSVDRILCGDEGLRESECAS
jgi:hypothetical protein